MINTAPINNATRQLPTLPVRQLPNPNTSKAHFDIQNQEEEILKDNFSRAGELFYYQTSSSSPSTSNNSSTTENSDNENNDQQEDEDDDETRRNQSDEDDDDDDETSPFEYDA